MKLLPALYCLLLAVTTSDALWAQQPPAFQIEKIVVRGVRFASESVVRSETRLAEGRTYSEPELRQAVARVNRLPFVLDSSFSLEKGETRGSYVLVVTITETKPLFVLAESSTYMQQGQRSHTGERLQAGGRWFLGGSSLVHASTDFENNYEAGITQYNLLRRGAWAALNVRWTSNDGTFETPGAPGGPDGAQRITSDLDPSLELRFGVPVGGNHSIVGQMGRDSQSHRITFLDAPGDRDETGGIRVRQGELAWLYDTTDDPLFPTSGTIWRTGATIGTFTSTSSRFGEATLRSRGARSSVTRYHPVNDYLSLSYGLTAGMSRHSSSGSTPGQIAFTSDSWGYGPSAGFSVSLWPHSLTRRLGDLRWQTSATYSLTEGEVIAVNTFSVDSSIAQRNVWGILRLSFRYIDAERN